MAGNSLAEKVQKFRKQIEEEKKISELIKKADDLHREKKYDQALKELYPILEMNIAPCWNEKVKKRIAIIEKDIEWIERIKKAFGYGLAVIAAAIGIYVLTFVCLLFFSGSLSIDVPESVYIEPDRPGEITIIVKDESMRGWFLQHFPHLLPSPFPMRLEMKTDQGLIQLDSGNPEAKSNHVVKKWPSYLVQLRYFFENNEEGRVYFSVFDIKGGHARQQTSTRFFLIMP